MRRIVADQPRVDRALEMLKQRCAEAGKPSLGRDAASSAHGREAPPTLYFGDCAAAGTSRPWMEAITRTTGCFATIFVCDRRAMNETNYDPAPGPSAGRFIRIATNLQLTDGSRATGTLLNPKGIAAHHLLAKQSHRGTAYILGKPYLASYEPLLSATQEVIGALYVGFPLDEPQTGIQTGIQTGSADPLPYPAEPLVQSEENAVRE
jgi:hypothetical protein